ncbi:transmembrane protein, putative (macronuclear) [Tetrahymena thermophila SB210]|uniref:Transmembrane protein, putative n=1 Tax=Tetrahymena thermophila (strain SB210) TaxID=312017 RepID=I7MAZ5_TETTS|nr:transmembrane protein, putative [Tetrahymena thermophila SB210]EAS07001.1 transmembrane protein, putative [Tetrahymena thermophila SB210]|eukprot:XP_001027243.1 transmembrane protein, putative [Tetrahymena thermophila SB210]
MSGCPFFNMIRIMTIAIFMIFTAIQIKSWYFVTNKKQVKEQNTDETIIKNKEEQELLDQSQSNTVQ